MKKALKIVIPYLLPILWFLYCFSEIEESILNHFGYEWCLIWSYLFAIVSVIALIIIKRFYEKAYIFYFIPVLFWWSGIILGAIGHSIPCCTGG